MSTATSTASSTTTSSFKTFSQRSGLLQLNMNEEVMIGSLLSCGALIGIVISSIIPPSFILRLITFFISFGIKSFWFAAVAILIAELTRKPRVVTSSLTRQEAQQTEAETQPESESTETTSDVDRHMKPALSIEMQQRKNHNITQSMPPLPKLPLPGLETPTADTKSSNKSGKKLNGSEEVERVVFHPQPSPRTDVKAQVDAYEKGGDKKNTQDKAIHKPSSLDDKLSAFDVLSTVTHDTNESHQYDPDWTHEKDDVTLKSYGNEVTPAAQEEMNSLRGRLQNLYTIIRQYKQQVHQITTRLSTKDTQIAEVIKSKHDALTQANTQITDFQHKLDELSRSNHLLSDNLRTLEQQNRQLKEEIRVLELRLRDAAAHNGPTLHEDEVVGGVDGLLSPIRAPHVYESLVDEDTDM